MKYLIFMMIMFTSMASHIIFDFNQKSDLKDWAIVNDVVMGGRSSGSFELSPQGYAVFKGSISLDNNGGFSSVRHKFERKSIKGFTKIVLTIKGDTKKYQFRIKSNDTKVSETYNKIISQHAKSSTLLSSESSGDGKSIKLNFDLILKEDKDQTVLLSKLSNVDGLSEIMIIAAKSDVDF